MNTIIDCACVIHGNYYDFSYVEKLYNSLSRNFSKPIQLHVYTEPARPIPNYMIKHALDDYAVSGPKKSWWYKMQLFDQNKFSGYLFYFDLDTVICGNLDWLLDSPRDKFYTIRDFTQIFSNRKFNLNSSVMCFDTVKFGKIYNQFMSSRDHIMERFRGDQEFLARVIPTKDIVFFDSNKVKSWRWQVFRGGINHHTREALNQECHDIDATTSIVVFHGNPKPHELTDEFVKKYWI